MEEREWRESLKPGDRVAISKTGWNAHYDFVRVGRLTKTFILIKWSDRNEQKFRKKDGREPGDSWTPSYLCKPTPEIGREIAHQKLIRKANHLCGNIRRPKNMETKELIAFIKAIKPFVKKEQ